MSDGGTEDMSRGLGPLKSMGGKLGSIGNALTPLTGGGKPIGGALAPLDKKLPGMSKHVSCAVYIHCTVVKMLLLLT